MTRVLLLRLDAPLMSFGGTVVDARNVTDDFPARSMITGLLGNALGYDHRDVRELTRLQERVRLGARRDREPERIVDFQTVDLTQPFMKKGWTTDGVAEERGKGPGATGTIIRLRHYLADGVYTLALALVPPDEAPTLEDLSRALDEPARPLFLGRKSCLPSERLVVGLVEAPSLLDALAVAPLSKRASDDDRKLVRVPRGMPPREGFTPSERAVTEERDWPNQIHVGRQRVLEGFVEIGRVEAGS